MKQREGFPSPYGPTEGLDVDGFCMNEVLYGAPGSTPVVDGVQPEGYVPFTYPDAPEPLAGGSMQPPHDPPRTLIGADDESHGRSLTIIRDDGSETKLEIIDD